MQSAVCVPLLMASTAVLAAFALGTRPASAQVNISGSARVADSPATPGTGLNGEYWDANVGSIAGAYAHFDANKPTATFTATKIDYPNGGSVPRIRDWTTLEHLLGANATGLDPSSAGTNLLDSSIFRFSGFINILDSFDTNPDTPGIDYIHWMGSDDGSRLTIGGETVLNLDGPHGYYGQSVNVHFDEAGLYPVEIVYFENEGYTGIEWWHKLGRTESDWEFVPTNTLYSSVPEAQLFRARVAADAPEPGTLALLGVGAAGLLRRRRAKRA